ncbi:hypothetical protein ROS217_13416 [Roseovarius sp. 217]|nr:hypothetical protein ROS217_13416 [Roseovarius sp. 217]
MPDRTITVSPFFSLAAILQHLRGERDDFHKVLGPQLAHDRPENTGADRLTCVVQDHGGVAVKTNGGPVFTTDFLGGAHDDGLADVPFLHAAAGDGFLDRDDNDVAHGCVSTLGTTQDLDALNSASARVVSNIQVGLHLDHLVSPDLWGAMQCLIPRVSINAERRRGLSLQHLPTLRLGFGRAFDNPNGIAHFERVVLIVSPVFLGLTNGFLKHGVLETALDRYGDGLGVGIRGDDALKNTFGHISGSLLCCRVGFFVQNRQNARGIAARRAHLSGILKLACGRPKTQIELLLFQVGEFFPELVRGLVTQFLGVHRLFLSQNTGRPLTVASG